jgi:hypothetical protein
MIRKALVIMIPLGVAWLVAAQWQDIIRYLKIKQMSAGSGHPENVPAGGSQAYPHPYVIPARGASSSARPGPGGSEGRPGKVFVK